MQAAKRFGLPDAVAQRLARALQAVVADPEFHERADLGGFIPTWRDGEAWATQARDECAELTKLWATEPWLQEGTG